MTMPNPDRVSRTLLLSMHDGTQPTIEDAAAAHADTGVILLAGITACNSVSGQAALLTAVLTAVRAFGNVLVLAGAPDAVIRAGTRQGRPLAQAIVEEGARLTTVDDTAAHPCWPTLIIGATTAPPTKTKSSAPVLRISWNNWTATVAPVDLQDHRSINEDCVLAAIAAAALGVSEAFSFVKPRAGSDAGYRIVNLNLWDPSGQADRGPRLGFAPAKWWLVGLGHLGQAYSWVISWLDYESPAAAEIVLQDTDKTTPANHSTGLLTPVDSDGVPKTRLIAAALDGVGFDTRIIERRLDNNFKVAEADVHVALLGVDNLATRRLTSGVGWRLAIDAGLGSSSSYSSILLLRFPGTQVSHEVPGWNEPDSAPASIPESPAFDDLTLRGDACGLVELAGKAVGASFVGAVAACLAVAEAVRGLHGGVGFEIATLDLTTIDPTTAPARNDADVFPLRLRSRS